MLQKRICIRYFAGKKQAANKQTLRARFRYLSAFVISTFVFSFELLYIVWQIYVIRHSLYGKRHLHVWMRIMP